MKEKSEGDEIWQVSQLKLGLRNASLCDHWNQRSLNIVVVRLFKEARVCLLDLSENYYLLYPFHKYKSFYQFYYSIFLLLVLVYNHNLSVYFHTHWLFLLTLLLWQLQNAQQHLRQSIRNICFVFYKKNNLLGIHMQMFCQFNCLFTFLLIKFFIIRFKISYDKAALAEWVGVLDSIFLV